MDFTPPGIAILGPANGSYTRIAQTIVSATITDLDNGIDPSSVVVLIDGQATEATADPVTVLNDNGQIGFFTFTVQPLAALDEGDHTVTVTAQNLNGSAFDSPDWTYTVDVTPPTATFIDPGDSQTVYIPNPVLTYWVGDNLSGVDPDPMHQTVVLYNNNTGETFTPPYTLDDYGDLTISPVNLTHGSYSIGLNFVDSAGDWQNPDDTCNASQTWNYLNVDLKTILVSINPSYGALPATWTATAVQGGIRRDGAV